MITIQNISCFSEKGIRDNNEDFILCQEDSRIIVLCDGMGGHGHGEVASQTVSEAVYGFLSNAPKEEYEPTDLQDALDYALSQLNSKDSFDDRKRMGTTLVVVVINKNNVLVGHVGDSRCYQFANDYTQKFRTKDHSIVQIAVDAGILTEEEARTNPNRNKLDRCIMAGLTEVEIEVNKLETQGDETLLLCSDGVIEVLRDNEIQDILKNYEPDKTLDEIKNRCEKDSHDNYSAIIVRLSQAEVTGIDDTGGDIDNPPKPEFKIKPLLLSGAIGFMLGLIIASTLANSNFNRAIERKEQQLKYEQARADSLENRYKEVKDSLKLLKESRNDAIIENITY